MELTIKQIQFIIEKCFYIYQDNIDIINSYVLDFFVKNHWNQFSMNLQNNLINLEAHEIANLLDYNNNMRDRVWPLSLLALKHLLVQYSVTREMKNIGLNEPMFSFNNSVLKSFWKKVKFKKRHEINLMSKMCHKTAQETKCSYIVDVGSGVGHLSRVLSYGYGYHVCSIESQKELSERAEELDQDFEKCLHKYCLGTSFYKIIKIVMHINSSISVEKFLKIIKNAFGIENDDFKFGIIGLHPCGDLATTLLRLYKNCPNAIFINEASCCYMKLSSSNEPFGFPLSDFCSSRNYTLSYESKEIACHAIENFIEKLREGEVRKLKIHTYRALIEKYIIELRPDLHHLPLANVTYSEDLSFKMYCKKALAKLNIQGIDDELKEQRVTYYLNQWKEVVIFYSVRLLFAPLIETIILLDRLLYIKESSSNVELIPLFDPKISPRIHLLIAKKS